MRHGSRRAKARRLEVAVAETLSRVLDLTILAEKPTKPGRRKTGARWVPEGEPADLKVRVMGQPGADVALLSERAQEMVAWPSGSRLGLVPFYIECKNVEERRKPKSTWVEPTWSFDRMLRTNLLPSVVAHGWAQASRAAGDARSSQHFLVRPLLVLGRNRFPPIAVVDARLFGPDELPAVVPRVVCRGLCFLPFVDFAKQLAARGK